jgi:hypothetical protein
MDGATPIAGSHDQDEAAGTAAPAASSTTTRVRLPKPVLRELRLQLLRYSSPFSLELELVEERHGNGDVVVRLARPDKRDRGETILGAYNEAVVIRLARPEQVEILLGDHDDRERAT